MDEKSMKTCSGCGVKCCVIDSYWYWIIKRRTSKSEFLVLYLSVYDVNGTCRYESFSFSVWSF